MNGSCKKKRLANKLKTFQDIKRNLAKKPNKLLPTGIPHDLDPLACNGKAMLPDHHHIILTHGLK